MGNQTTPLLVLYLFPRQYHHILTRFRILPLPIQDEPHVITSLIHSPHLYSVSQETCWAVGCWAIGSISVFLTCCWFACLKKLRPEQFRRNRQMSTEFSLFAILRSNHLYSIFAHGQQHLEHVSWRTCCCRRLRCSCSRGFSGRRCFVRSCG